jgi:hypothetical protein
MDDPEKGLSPTNPAAAPRVSTNRQGVIATKMRASGDTVFVVNGSWGSDFAWLARQYWGVDQFFSGIALSCALCAVNMRGRKARRDTARPGYFEKIT